MTVGATGGELLDSPAFWLRYFGVASSSDIPESEESFEIAIDGSVHRWSVVLDPGVAYADLSLMVHGSKFKSVGWFDDVNPRCLALRPAELRWWWFDSGTPPSPAHMALLTRFASPVSATELEQISAILQATLGRCGVSSDDVQRIIGRLSAREADGTWEVASGRYVVTLGEQSRAHSSRVAENPRFPHEEVASVFEGAPAWDGS